MKRIYVLFLTLWGIVSLTVANETALITISSDGIENSYLLASVKHVTFTESAFSTMSIEKKDGSVVNTLYVSGISENETLSVFNLSGKCVIKTTGNEVNVNEHTTGVHIILRVVAS